MYEDPQVMVDVEKVLLLFKGLCGKKRQEKKRSCGAKAQSWYSDNYISVQNGNRDIWLQSSCNQRNCLFHQVFWQQQH